MSSSKRAALDCTDMSRLALSCLVLFHLSLFCSTLHYSRPALFVACLAYNTPSDRLQHRPSMTLKHKLPCVAFVCVFVPVFPVLPLSCNGRLYRRRADVFTEFDLTSNTIHLTSNTKYWTSLDTHTRFLFFLLQIIPLHSIVTYSAVTRVAHSDTIRYDTIQ